ncbi:MAG: lysylphosphatidylglycerol synthase domain-containing protein [Acidilobaceae archaeon]
MFAGIIDVVLSVASRASLYFLMLAMIVYFISVLISSLRWLIASRLDIKFSNVLALSEALLVGTFVNNLLSFYNIAGEAARVGWASLRVRSSSSSKLLAGALAERATELIVAIPYISLAVYSGFKFTLLTLASTIGFRGYALGVLSALKDLISNPKAFFSILILSASMWLLDSLRIFVVGLSLGIYMSLGLAIVLTITHILSRFSPIPAGLGVLEGGFIGIMTLAGYSVTDALLVVTGERIVSTIIPTSIGGLIVFYRGGLGVLRTAIRGVRVEDSSRY